MKPSKPACSLGRLVLRRSLYGVDRLGAVVLIGDRPGPSAPSDPAHVHVPFLSTRHCSGWFNGLLDAANISEEDLVWRNAFDQYGRPTDISTLMRLEPFRAIIALGGNADRWLRVGGYESREKFPHPQYWKRFHFKEQYPLITRLKELTDA